MKGGWDGEEIKGGREEEEGDKREIEDCMKNYSHQYNYMYT